MLDKLFGWGKKKPVPEQSPAISFGRYSDNNKPLAKVNRWTEAEKLYKEKKYTESIDAFFDYLRDDEAANVVYERNGAGGRFQFYQGSKVVRGTFSAERINAEVTLARMAQPSVPVMRRLLEMNFNLFYGRYALENDRLCMKFDSDPSAASPSKLYYGLKELATKADKQDDLLVQDFATLESTDIDHITPVADAEKVVKYKYLQIWIKEALDYINTLDTEKFAAGIAYMLLSLIYRIDYLITPEGKLLNDLEKIGGIYFKKDERSVIDKSKDMVEEFKKLQQLTKEEINSYLFRSRYTYSIVAPQPFKTITDNIHVANQSMAWYRENNHPLIASQIIEYGIMHCQYTYSLPQAITELIHLYMMISYSHYFAALGFGNEYYNAESTLFDERNIEGQIKNIQRKWKEKFPLMNFKTVKLRYDSLLNFNYSFTNEMEFLNMEPK
ncbi:MAG: hypothetical protein ABIP79_00205 [Chitinophagaceae bacterium]